MTVKSHTDWMVEGLEPPTGSDHLSRAEQAYLTLKQALRERWLNPGQRLREVDIAELLGMSRTPVREALRRLESDGLIVVQGRRGFVVNSLSRQQVSDLYVMREVLEGTAARLAAQQASTQEIQLLMHFQEQLESCDEAEEFARLDRELHDTIYNAAHNSYLLSALNALADALLLLGRTTYVNPDRRRDSVQEHRALVQAIAARDPDAAEAAARAHIRASFAVRLKMLYDGHRN